MSKLLTSSWIPPSPPINDRNGMMQLKGSFQSRDNMLKVVSLLLQTQLCEISRVIMWDSDSLMTAVCHQKIHH